MSTCILKKARLALLALLLFISPLVFGLGLGNVTVESFLNQPLNARIDLLVRPGEDISGVTARLASAEDYALIGASRDAISVPLRFVVDTQSDQPFVRVTSSLPVNQPVVRLIIELNWASGRLLREYTLFLDPPAVPAAAPPPVVDERRQVAAPEVPAVTDVPVETPVPEILETESTESGDSAADPDSQISDQTASSPEAQFGDERDYGPVQSGDTLWKIASNWSAGSAASINQVMLAIQRNNPQAFINNNINLVKRGAILRMPNAAEIAALSVAEATAEVRAQAELFAANSTARPEPQAVSPAVETPLVDVASDMSSSSQADAVVDDSPKLEIVPPSAESNADSAYGDEDSPEGSSASTSMVTLQEELARKEEALITEQQTNEYLQQRIKELEEQGAETDSASLEVEDEQLAQLEDRLREERLAAADTSTQSSDANRDAAKPLAANQTAAESAGPWYQRLVTWLIAGLVLVVAALGWFLSRRGQRDAGPDFVAANQETVREIKDEAEEILRVLEPADRTVVSDEPGQPGETEIAIGTPVEPDTDKPSRFSQARHLHHEEAFVLDEDSADPEVRLDLARAYISMGDREAARAILGEVIETGDSAQKSEAQSMLDAM
jgi:pilus assembly protein FimV